MMVTPPSAWTPSQASGCSVASLMSQTMAIGFHGNCVPHSPRSFSARTQPQAISTARASDERRASTGARPVAAAVIVARMAQSARTPGTANAPKRSASAKKAIPTQ